MEELLPLRLRDRLRDELPPYMVPSAFVVLDRLPRTANGKLDRRALPKPGVGDDRRTSYVEPREGAEKRIAEVFAEVLGVERVGVHDNFFEVGGHSLLAQQLVIRLEPLLGTDARLDTFFRHTMCLL